MVFVGINISGMGLDGSTVYKIGIEDGELIGAVDSSIETTESDWYRMIVHKVWDQKLVVVRIRYYTQDTQNSQEEIPQDVQNKQEVQETQTKL
ncbi:22988_t:CDS:2 [Rhizophagus irregularis]|nr:22988_t:CDS:2 [Rhizophagus irregularis]